MLSILIPIKNASKLLTSFFSLLFPLPQAVLEARRCTELVYQPEVVVKMRRRVATLTSIHGDGVRSALHAFKYHHDVHSRDLFQKLLREHFSDRALQTMYIIPIPLHPSRAHTRGYCQLLFLLDGLIPKEHILDTLLIRQKNKISQTHQTKQSRKESIRNAFLLHPHANTVIEKLPKEARIILLDDVITTGATLSECARILDEIHLPHSLLTLCH
jgi:predicted amidophosphoribosyltransferase